MEELKSLVERATSGDRNAFSEIYKLYVKKVYRYCKFNTYDEQTAQDICQESFVRAWKKIQDFKMDSNWSIQAFLFTIARNLIIDRSRGKKEFALENYEHIETNEDLYESIDREMHVKNVQEGLRKLDEVDRQIIILRYFEDMDGKEVAKVLGIKDGALRVRQHRAMEKLKIIMEKTYGKRN